MSSIFTLVHVLGLVALGFSGLMTSCLATSYFNHDGATQAFLDSIVKGDERKDPWEISRTTEISDLWEHSISEVSTFLTSMVDEAGSLV